jgi:CRISPR-associated endonuclease/helicase Cas3
MSDLTLADFSVYFRAVHGFPPFAWQVRLLDRVVRDGRWPALVDLPTGSGKTACIDIALFHLALDRGATAPRRIVLVVDRRTVVDQSHERAEVIAAALKRPGNPVVQCMAERLRALVGSDLESTDPLWVAQLRGGMPRDDAWARRPDQAVVALSTVDQVGSRLLFRGYGVSEGMRPIHAGLVGNDTLFLLDEVHLAQPFHETLRAVGRYRAGRQSSLPDRWQVVAMSATPTGAPPEGGLFRLEESDRTDDVLARRLRARKPAEIVPEIKVTGSPEQRRETFAQSCVAKAISYSAPGKTIAIVVNRVDTARRAFAGVRRAIPNASAYLVTGRMRAIDRNDRDDALRGVARSGRARDPDAPPVFVIATQCIEAGADFDFDALVTECASLDALRQRLGRLNRLGEAETSPAAILARADAVGDDADDLVYGAALAATWRWLGEAVRDFGIDAMNASLPDRERLLTLVASSACAPTMLPSHLDTWVQTRPTPFPDPEVALWLHGIERPSEPDVQVVWRADVDDELLAAARTGDKQSMRALLAMIEACAPVGLEAMSVPAYAVRAWLAGDAPADVADVEGGGAPTEGDAQSAGRLAFDWRGDESVVIEASDVRGGHTLIVPVGYGGITDGSWDPTSKVVVTDLAHRARWLQHRRPTLRMHASISLAPFLGLAAALDESSGEERTDRDRVSSWLEATEEVVIDDEAPVDARALAEIVTALRGKKKRWTIIRVERPAIGATASVELIVVGKVSRSDIAAEDDGASHTGCEVSLDAHMRGVADWAKGFSERCGLSAAMVEDLVLAGRWHDAGKADVRFQRMLRGGASLLAEDAEPLAKSSIVVGDVGARRRAQERAGYPRGARHELSSVTLLEEQSALLDQAHDRDLVLHLVASHHGWCRPFAPVVVDKEPVDIVLAMDGKDVKVSSAHGLSRLDAGVADRFWALVRRYGWFGLAWLEAILRLADHRRSEEEQREGIKSGGGT